MRDFRAEADKMLEESGGLYRFEDILYNIEAGYMQSHTVGNTMAVTQVHNFPRKRVLDVVMLAGEASDLEALEEKVIEFAKECGADLIMASARLGFTKLNKPGWKKTSVNFVRPV